MFRIALALSLLIGNAGLAQVAGFPGPQITAPLVPLLEALANGGVSGSLELSRCAAVGPFPKLRASSVRQGSLVQAVREMFADDSFIHVTREANGTIRMIESGVQTDLLNVRIGRIPFEVDSVPQQSAFNPTTALAELLQSPAVVSFMETHQIKLVVRPQGSLHHGLFPDNSPHIAESIQDVTLSQALDRILKTFPGIWV